MSHVARVCMTCLYAATRVVNTVCEQTGRARPASTRRLQQCADISVQRRDMRPDQDRLHEAQVMCHALPQAAGVAGKAADRHHAGLAVPTRWALGSQAPSSPHTHGSATKCSEGGSQGSVLSLTSRGQRARRRHTHQGSQPGVMMLAAQPAAIDRMIGPEKHGYGLTCIEARSQR